MNTAILNSRSYKPGLLVKIRTLLGELYAVTPLAIFLKAIRAD